jgi:hypothetical protein
MPFHLERLDLLGAIIGHIHSVCPGRVDGTTRATAKWVVIFPSIPSTLKKSNFAVRESACSINTIADINHANGPLTHMDNFDAAPRKVGKQPDLFQRLERKPDGIELVD